MGDHDKVAVSVKSTVYHARMPEKDVLVEHGPAEDFYAEWPTPVCIVSDGAYGVGGFPGDPRSHRHLADWYEPHVAAWTARASACTTLWFWNTEVGWATVHPVLERRGWIYRGCSVWDKGVGHIAGNVNTGTIRRFPPVTEVCAHYVRPPRYFKDENGELTMQDWLRSEWRRTGLPLSDANRACGVADAATRKYLTGDSVWYAPPPAMFDKLASHANERGDPAGRPYFSLDGAAPASASDWRRERAKFKCPFGATNVWSVPQVGGSDRLRNPGGSVVHANQKPLALIRMIVEASTDGSDVVWEPFGGLCPAAVVCVALERRYRGAEPSMVYHDAAMRRLNNSDEIVSMRQERLWPN